ncbi:MAG: DnaJ domain-containing protein [Ignavibacteria bacterium]|nr:DnaJ domain-containing protein [Ignavibacteria bacterium]
MKQIFDRIKNILKAELNSADSSDFLDIDIDDNLKKEFDNLSDNKNNWENNFTIDLDEKKAFAILEISSEVSNDEIKRAYLSKMKEYHPDKVENLGKEIRLLAEQKTKEINEAYNLLRKKRGF